MFQWMSNSDSINCGLHVLSKTHFPDNSLLSSYIIVKFNWIIKDILNLYFWGLIYLWMSIRCLMTCSQGLYILEGASLKGLFPTQIKKDPYQALLTSSYAMELKRIDSWINISTYTGALYWTGLQRGVLISKLPLNNIQRENWLPWWLRW